jgi:hypothetical protein
MHLIPCFVLFFSRPRISWRPIYNNEKGNDDFTL